MTLSQTRFVNLLNHPESKSGLDGTIAAGNYYLHATEMEREELRSFMSDLLNNDVRSIRDILLYVIVLAKDQRLIPLLRTIAADEKTSLRSVAWQVLQRESHEWTVPPHVPWFGAPLTAFDNPVDVHEWLCDLDAQNPFV